MPVTSLNLFQKAFNFRNKLNKTSNSLLHNPDFKGSYLDFSYLTELKYIYPTEIYMKKQQKLSNN